MLTKKLSLIDDGTLSGGIGTASTDDEGTPSGINELVKNGALNSFIYDCYTAGKEKRESTGNAVRGFVHIHAFNKYPKPYSDYPRSDIVKRNKRWRDRQFSDRSAYGKSHIRRLSVGSANSFIISEGEPVSPIRSMMISGNIFELLNNIEGAGKDVRRVG